MKVRNVWALLAMGLFCILPIACSGPPSESAPPPVETKPAEEADKQDEKKADEASTPVTEPTDSSSTTTRAF